MTADAAFADLAAARQLMTYAGQIRALAASGYDGADDAEAIAAALERQAGRLAGGGSAD